MNYKYKKNQIFGKRLKVPTEILNQIYSNDIKFEDYIKYELEEKIPTTCIREEDRKILEKFGMEKTKKLNWTLLNKKTRYDEPNYRKLLMTIDQSKENPNLELYEIIKDQIPPEKYPEEMKQIYSDRFFDLSTIEKNSSKKTFDQIGFNLEEMRAAVEYDVKSRFNQGRIGINEMIARWNLLKDKDLSYCLAQDPTNEEHITNDELKEVMKNYEQIYKILFNHFRTMNMSYSIRLLQDKKTEEEKKEFLKKYTDKILTNLRKTYEKDKIMVNIRNGEYKEIFKYSSLEEFLSETNYFYSEALLKELETLPKNYIYEMPIPITELMNSDVLTFIAKYNLKNIVDFDNECGHFFTKNHCEMLKLMYEAYIHYGNNNYDPEKDLNTKNPVDENGKYVDRPYNKEEFYEAIRRMIVYGPTTGDFDDNIPNYEAITGEFRERNPDLFISEDAPEELRKLFYTKSLLPSTIIDNPEYIKYLENKNLGSCFRKFTIKIGDEYGEYENFYNFLSKKTDYKELMNFIIEYGYIIELLSIYQIEKEDDLNTIKRKTINEFKNQLIRHRVPYQTNIAQSLIDENEDMFLVETAPKELQEVFYNRTIDSEYILSHPEYIKYLKNIDIEIIYRYIPVKLQTYSNEYKQINLIAGIKETFKDDSFEVMLDYGKYIEQIYELTYLNRFEYNKNISQEELLTKLDLQIYKAIIDGKIKYDENISEHFKSSYPNLFLDETISKEIKDKFYNRKFSLKDFNDNPELIDIFKNTNIVYAFNEQYAWISTLFDNDDNKKLANYNRIKVISAYSKIQDNELQKAFQDYVRENQENINLEKIEYVSEVLTRLSLSNSNEIFTFRKELANQILNSNEPLEVLTKVEEIFIKNNLPTVGKIYSCFEILHPNFEGFEFSINTMSPILKKSSVMAKKIIVFSDLIKASFGSNNRTIKNYLHNIEVGTKLYENIKNGAIKYEDLTTKEQKELITFSKHLQTLYNNTQKGKKEENTFISSGNYMDDIFELVKKISPDGTTDYKLDDRIIRMFCGFAGINTLETAQRYMEKKIVEAEERNKRTAKEDLKLEKGDFIKGIGSVSYLSNILQNGSVSKEFLGSSADSDATPLDTDVSMITSDEDSVKMKLASTAAASYGPIWFVIKNDERFITTRTSTDNKNQKRDLTKLEAFYTGVLNEGHYGIRTGFASSEINCIMMENYDPKVGLEIALNGFYIPVANTEGKIVFKPEDYENLREKMSGLSYYGADEFVFSENLITEEIKELANQIKENNEETEYKRQKINESIKKSLDELGLELKVDIDGDLTDGFVELIDTGSTGRKTNKPGDGDFDFMMRLDRNIIQNYKKLEKLKETILKNLIEEKQATITSSGDFRLKNVLIEENTEVDIDITFVEKSDNISYSTDQALKERLETIKEQSEEKYNYVIANILQAKQVLKEAGVYKPNRGETPQGGLGGVGIENWILQHGGSFIDAAQSFVETAENKSFQEFKKHYQVWDFGENHLADKKGNYKHDNFIENNMTEEGYQKMVPVLKEYLNTLTKENEIQTSK